MNSFDNNRICDRENHNMRIIYTESGSEKCHPVKILNYSENGIYFENLHHISPGTVLVFYSRGGELPEQVAVKNFTSFKSMARAEVKWCKDLKDREYPHFGVGTQYL